MASKRAATTSAKPRGRPAKAAKLSPAVEEDKFAPVMNLMAEYCTMNASCNSMLAAALPLALMTKKEERHLFEVALIKTFEDACCDAGRGCNSAVQAAEVALTKHAEEVESSAARLGAAESSEANAAEQKNAAQGRYDEKEKAKDEAEAAVKSAERDLAASENEVQDQTAKKQAFEKECEEVLPGLKEGAFAPKDWRLRQKAIARLSQLLEQSDAPVSLVAASQLAFKDKPESRSQFAVMAVEAAEAQLQTRRETLAQGIAEASGKADELRACSTAKEEALKAVQSEHDAAQEALITASNEWVEADSEVQNLKAEKSNFGQKEVELKTQLADSQASLERFQGLLREFEVLRDQVPSLAAEVAGEGAEVAASAPVDDGEQAAAGEGAEVAASAPVADGEHV